MTAALVYLGLVLLAGYSLRPATTSLAVRPAPPLMLTPLIESSEAARAREMARFEDGDSYSGFVTTNKTTNTSLFFWFFHARPEYVRTAPLVIWLQGGPGTSSLRAVFLEHGPFEWQADTQRVELRPHAWTDRHSVLYVDNPAGVGFSFTESDDGYATSPEDAAEGLLELLRQFFAMFPDLRSTDFYVAGESFGGRFTVALGDAIHKNKDLGINLRGLVIVNGLVDASIQLRKSDMAHALGILDDQQRERMRLREDKMVASIQKGDFAAAAALSLDDCGGSLSPEESGFNSVTNIQYENGSLDLGYEQVLNRPETRAGLHVGGLPFVGRSRIASANLRASVYKSALPELQELLEHYRVMVVSGDLDLCLPHLRASEYLNKMTWSGADEWRRAPRHVWRVNRELAGYAKTSGQLTEVLVRGAGHYLAQDQPWRSEDALFRFTRGLDFDKPPPPRFGASDVSKNGAARTLSFLTSIFVLFIFLLY